MGAFEKFLTSSSEQSSESGMNLFCCLLSEQLVAEDMKH